MKYLLRFVLLVTCAVQWCYGQTDVHIANNTPYTMQYRVVYFGQKKKLTRGKQYQVHGCTIAPWGHETVLRFNRFYVPSHSTHRFTIYVQMMKNGKPIGKEVALSQELTMKMLTSQVAYGVAHSPLRKIKKIRASSIKRTKNICSVGGVSIDLLSQNLPKKGIFHDIEYAFTLQPYEHSTFDDTPHRLRVYHHNLFMRPTLVFHNDGQVERAKHIPKEIATVQPIKPDVVAFDEVFEQKSLQQLIKQMKKEGYVYHTPVLAARSANLGNVIVAAIKSVFAKKSERRLPTITNGGVVIFSRWPIQKIDEVTFGKILCSGFDALADKGCLYARIDKKGVVYNVFATHTNVEGDAIKEGQIKVIKAFIDRQHIPKHEPIVIAADMNVCRNNPNAKHMYKKMLDMLNVTLPECRGCSCTFARGGKNVLCNDQHLPSMYLDYIFFKKDHRCPSVAYNQVSVSKMRHKPWINRSNHIYYKGRWEYSDHYPVYGYLEFKH